MAAHKQHVSKRDGIQFHLAFLQPNAKQIHFSPVTQLAFRAFCLCDCLFEPEESESPYAPKDFKTVTANTVTSLVRRLT